MRAVAEAAGSGDGLHRIICRGKEEPRPCDALAEKLRRRRRLEFGGEDPVKRRP